MGIGGLSQCVKNGAQKENLFHASIVFSFERECETWATEFEEFEDLQRFGRTEDDQMNAVIAVALRIRISSEEFYVWP